MTGYDIGKEFNYELAEFWHAKHSQIYTELKKLDFLISKMEPRIIKAQDEMREAFSEQKKAEIIQEQREKEEAEKIAKKENSNLDDIGVEVFRRKDEQ